MRLKEDNSSWKSSGIMRRDFRHDPGLPETEVPRHRPKKSKPPRRKIGHKHVWTAFAKPKLTDYYWFTKPGDFLHTVASFALAPLTAAKLATTRRTRATSTNTRGGPSTIADADTCE